MSNKKNYIRFWIGVLIVSIITALMGCAPVQEVVYEDVYLNGGMYTENDTIIGIDTTYYWTKEK